MPLLVTTLTKQTFTDAAFNQQPTKQKFTSLASGIKRRIVISIGLKFWLNSYHPYITNQLKRTESMKYQRITRCHDIMQPNTKAGAQHDAYTHHVMSHRNNSKSVLCILLCCTWNYFCGFEISMV